MLSLREAQTQFLVDIARLVLFAAEHPNVALTAGDFYAQEGHMAKSLHGERLAADLNLFLLEPHPTEEGRFVWNYIRGDHSFWYTLGAKWKSLHSQNRWGGDFAKRDWNHFSHTIDKRA